MTDRKRILVVDDDRSLMRMLRLNLEDTGRYVVREEGSSRAAVAAALDFAPDLILLDVMMPDLDGGELSARLKAHPKLKHVPIVFLTAAVKKREVHDGHGRIGGLPFLAKPVDLDELTACMDRYMGPPVPSPAPDAPPGPQA
jgi:CheY-like chemotaxis protein